MKSVVPLDVYRQDSTIRMSAPILSATFAVDAFIESRAKWAYLAVVQTRTQTRQCERDGHGPLPFSSTRWNPGKDARMPETLERVDIKHLVEESQRNVR